MGKVFLSWIEELSRSAQASLPHRLGSFITAWRGARAENTRLNLLQHCPGELASTSFTCWYLPKEHPHSWESFGFGHAKPNTFTLLSSACWKRVTGNTGLRLQHGTDTVTLFQSLLGSMNGLNSHIHRNREVLLFLSFYPTKEKLKSSQYNAGTDSSLKSNRTKSQEMKKASENSLFYFQDQILQ